MRGHVATQAGHVGSTMVMGSIANASLDRRIEFKLLPIFHTGSLFTYTHKLSGFPFLSSGNEEHSVESLKFLGSRGWASCQFPTLNIFHLHSQIVRIPTLVLGKRGACSRISEVPREQGVGFLPISYTEHFPPTLENCTGMHF